MTSEELIPMLRKSAEALAKATNDLGDKATWSPNDKGRNAGNQIAECALLSGGAVQAVESGAFPPMDFEKFGAIAAELGNQPEQALAMLSENTEKLCAAISVASQEKLDSTIELPWGEKTTLSGAAMLIYWNNTYHEGQINYISTLVG
jgi:hypothetical protein